MIFLLALFFVIIGRVNAEYSLRYLFLCLSF